MSAQTADNLLKRTNAIIASGTARIKSVDRDEPHLHPEVRKDRIERIRAQTADALKPVLDTLTKLQAGAQTTLPSLSQETARRRAFFAMDPTQKLAAVASVQMSSTSEIVDFLQDAVADGDLAKAELCRKEFVGRADRASFARQFATIFRGAVDTTMQDREVEARAIISRAQLATVVTREFAQDVRLPVERMSAARVANALPVSIDDE